MIDDKPFSQACENNKGFILEVLKQEFKAVNSVLEIGSGTGQHAAHFAKHLSHLTWQTSDQLEYHQGIYLWLQEYQLNNLFPPLQLRLLKDPWPEQDFDGFFTANTAHIMQKSEVIELMRKVNLVMPKTGVFCQYGPFKVDGKFTSQSNEDFHNKLVGQGLGGYRDIEELQEWATALNLEKIIEMPANNLLLVWRK